MSKANQHVRVLLSGVTIPLPHSRGVDDRSRYTIAIDLYDHCTAGRGNTAGLHAVTLKVDKTESLQREEERTAIGKRNMRADQQWKLSRTTLDIRGRRNTLLTDSICEDANSNERCYGNPERDCASSIDCRTPERGTLLLLAISSLPKEW